MLKIKAPLALTDEQIAARPANFAAEVLACDYAKNYNWEFRLAPEALAKMLTEVRAAERERCAQWVADNYADKNIVTICYELCTMPEDTAHILSYNKSLSN